MKFSNSYVKFSKKYHHIFLKLACNSLKNYVKFKKFFPNFFKILSQNFSYFLKFYTNQNISLLLVLCFQANFSKIILELIRSYPAVSSKASLEESEIFLKFRKNFSHNFYEIISKYLQNFLKLSAKLSSSFLEKCP